MGRNSDANIRLMDAALELMWEESYGAVTIDDICNRAEVKKGSFYYFFKSKADLAVAAIDRMWTTDWKPTLDDLFSSSRDPLPRLMNYFDWIYRGQVQIKKKHGKVLGCPICSVGSEISTQEVDVNAKVREVFSRKRRYYESTIRDAIADGSIEPCDAAEKAIALAGFIEGVVAQARIMNDPEILASLGSQGLSLLGAKRSLAVSG
jgi:TetR/AcrR family transcriptional regulator, transcriptional repressor for nem operon